MRNPQARVFGRKFGVVPAHGAVDEEDGTWDDEHGSGKHHVDGLWQVLAVDSASLLPIAAQ